MIPLAACIVKRLAESTEVWNQNMKTEMSPSDVKAVILGTWDSNED